MAETMERLARRRRAGHSGHMNGLICAFAVASDGAARPLDGPDAPLRDGEWKWLHFERTNAEAENWVRHHSGIDKTLTDALLSAETRPRYARENGGTLIILRGVNLNKGADAHKMISLRIFGSEKLVVTLRREVIFALQDIREKYEAGTGPATPLDFAEAVMTGLTRRIAETVGALEDRLDELEERATLGADEALRQDLIGLRRQIVPIRRYVMPQKEALLQLARDGELMDRDHQERIMFSADETTRLVEVLDASRERAGLLQDQISGELAETMNRNTYALSIIAAVFLPLGFLTGLLGINVGGVPGTGNSWAFWIVVILCIISAGLVVWALKRARLM